VDSPPGSSPIITFYSYKGGVGRSMALANVAVLLARDHGKDVIVVDWDVEAPGLHRFFNIPEDTIKDGLIDYLFRYKERMRSSSFSQGVLDIEPVLITAKEFHPSGGRVRLLAAGDLRDPGAYAKRVNEFDWNDFYARWNGAQFFEYFRLQLARGDNRVVLIDSRTGLTDVGGICTMQMPDIVVLIFAFNEQNLTGTERMAKVLSGNNELFEKFKRHPRMIFLPARKELSEIGRLREWEGIAAQRLWMYMTSDEAQNSTPIVEDALKPIGENRGLAVPYDREQAKLREQEALKLIRENAVLYVPYFAFGDELAADTPRGYELVAAYSKLAGELAGKRGEVETVTTLQQELERSARGFQVARGILAKWKALLRPSQQFKMLRERMRQPLRFRYGPAKAFALLSTIRLLVYPIALALFGAYGVWIYQPSAAADQIFSKIGVPQDRVLTSVESVALWKLSQSPYAVQRQVLNSVVSVSGEKEARQFAKRAEYVTHAVIGLNLETRDKVKRDILPTCYAQSWNNSATARACELLVVQTDAGSGAAKGYLLPAVKSVIKSGSWDQPNAPLPGLGAVAGDLSEQERALVFGQILDALQKTINPDQMQSLGLCLEALARGLNQRDAPAAVARILDQMKDSISSEKLRLLARDLAAVVRRLSGSDADAAADEILEQLRGTSDPKMVGSLTYALSALPASLVMRSKAWEASSAVLRSAPGKTTDPYQLALLTTAYSYFPLNGATELSRKVVDAIEKTNNPDQMDSLAQNLDPRFTISSADAATATKHVTNALLESPNPPCAAFAPLMSLSTISQAIDLLKWPTCSATDREKLIQRIGTLRREQLSGDLWEFIAWAEKHGFDVQGKPSFQSRLATDSLPSP
jgi:CobQ/CobB/MinD/ParA nucleotide binding domain